MSLDLGGRRALLSRSTARNAPRSRRAAQTHALTQAERDGVPFCEECEKARKKRQSLALQIGSLLPASALEGAQSRLMNLGYLTGEIDGSWDAPTRKALQQFQREAGLEPTGELDPGTADLLVSVHDGI
jgi:putative peptidoglycan binding protein